ISDNQRCIHDRRSSLRTDMALVSSREQSLSGHSSDRPASIGGPSRNRRESCSGTAPTVPERRYPRDAPNRSPDSILPRVVRKDEHLCRYGHENQTEGELKERI